VNTLFRPFALNERACATMSCGGKYRGYAHWIAEQKLLQRIIHKRMAVSFPNVEEFIAHCPMVGIDCT
jgi:hypothetical protein